MRNLNVREMGKSLEVKCCVKITVSMVGYPGIPEEVVYWRANLTIGLLEKWRWYFDYLAALVKVANPKRSVRLTAGRQDVLVGQEYVEEKTRTLLIGKRRVLSRLDRQTDDDLFGFTSADRERKRQRIMKEIEELESGVFRYYVPPVYINKLRKWMHTRTVDEVIGDYLHGSDDGFRLQVIRQQVK